MVLPLFSSGKSQRRRRFGTSSGSSSEETETDGDDEKGRHKDDEEERLVLSPATRRRNRGQSKKDEESTSSSDEGENDSEGTASDSSSASDSSGEEEDDRKRKRKRKKKKGEEKKKGSTLWFYVGMGSLALLCAGGGIYLFIVNKNASSTNSGSGSSGTNADPFPTTSSPNDINSDPFGTVPSMTSSTTASPPPPSSTSTSTSAAASSSSTGSYTLPGVSKNNIGIGFLPDDASGQTMAALNSALGIKSSFYGWYAQLNNEVPWDGSQLTQVMDDLKASGAIFQPAVMPTGGWSGLTASDNSQGAAIASVMKQFTDEGIEVWLRFGHEVNWYQTDGTYTGDENDFKAAWAVVAAAVKDNTLVKMFFTPNWADLATYQKYYPDDPTTVDIIGIDAYPSSGIAFTDTMKPFHDAYCLTSDTVFAIGETGLGYTADITTKLSYLDAMTNSDAKTALPKLVGVSWFNYNKEEYFYLYDPDSDSLNSATNSWLQSGTAASGASAP